MMPVFPIKKLTFLAIIVIHLSISWAAYSYSRSGSYGTSSRRGSYGRGSYGTSSRRGSYRTSSRGGTYGRGSYGRGGGGRGYSSRQYGRRPSYPGIRTPTTTFAPCPIDENLCNGGDCLQPQFQCVNNGRCIPRSWYCNGVVDCSDSSDERGCPPPPCVSFEEFECLKNSQCVNLTERCDGKIDCDDASDELNCNEHSRDCNNKQFTCKEHYRCIFRDYLCDGEEDCDDGSDENHCGNVSSSSTTLAFVLTGTRETTPDSSPVSETRETTNTTIVTENNPTTKIAETTPASTITVTTPASTVTETTPVSTITEATPASTITETTLFSTITEATPASTVTETTPTTTITETTPASTITDITERSCPDNYCMQNSECVAINGQYYCNCSPSFSGGKCELEIPDEHNFQDLGIVIGVSLASIIMLTAIILGLVYYFNRKSFRHSTALMSKTESQMPITSYSKE